MHLVQYVKIFASSLVAMAIFTVCSQATEPNVPSIAVSGTGTVSTKPDIARISFGVISQESTAREALDTNNLTMANVLKQLQNSGIAEKDIQTSQFNIQPVYVYPPSTNNQPQKPPRIVGYTVNNSVTLVLREIEKTGETLDQLITLGINSASNIDFANDDPSKLLREARADAVLDARAKAETLASSAGVKLGKILSISEGSNNARPVAYAQSRSLREAGSAVPIASGEQTYQVSVQVEWAIEQ